MEESSLDLIKLPGRWNIINTLNNGWSRLYNALLGRYLQTLNTELYGAWIKPVFSLESHTTGASSTVHVRVLQDFLARDQVAKLVLLLSFIIFSYIILSYLNTVPSYWESGQPVIIGILTFYVFLVVPFKNTHFMASIRDFFTKEASFLDHEDMFAVDESIFLIFVIIFFSSLYIIKSINRKFRIGERIEQKLHFSVKSLFSRIYSGAVFLLFTLYCLNLGVPKENGNYQLVINIVVFLTFAVYAVIFLTNNETKKQASACIKTVSDCISKHAFSFLRLCVNISYYVILSALIILDVAPHSTVCENFCAFANSVFFYLFTHEIGFSFILAKVGLLVCFILHCIYNEMQRNRKYATDECLSGNSKNAVDFSSFEVSEYKLHPTESSGSSFSGGENYHSQTLECSQELAERMNKGCGFGQNYEQEGLISLSNEKTAYQSQFSVQSSSNSGFSEENAFKEQGGPELGLAESMNDLENRSIVEKLVFVDTEHSYTELNMNTDQESIQTTANSLLGHETQVPAVNEPVVLEHSVECTATMFTSVDDDTLNMIPTEEEALIKPESTYEIRKMTESMAENEELQYNDNPADEIKESPVLADDLHETTTA